MFSTTLSFDTPEHYDLYMTCHAHGWKNLSPFRWDENERTLHFAVFIDQIPADFFAIQSEDKICVTLKTAGQLDNQCLQDARVIVHRSLGLGIETIPLLEKAKKVGPEYAKIVKMGAGRLLRSPTLWEDAAKTLFTTNCTWLLTKKMCEAFCSEVFSKAAPSGAYPFPTPEKISHYSIKELNKSAPVGYRAEYLLSLAKHFVQDPFLKNIENNGYSYNSADAIVRKLRGFGDYATAHMLLLTGYYDEVPIDTVVVSYLKKNHRVRKPQSFINRTYRKWGKYKWWGLKLEKILRHQNWLGD